MNQCVIVYNNKFLTKNRIHLSVFAHIWLCITCIQVIGILFMNICSCAYLYISLCIEVILSLSMSLCFYLVMDHMSKRESSRRKVWLHAWTQDEDGQSLAGNGTFWKSRGVGKATSKRWLQLFGKRQNEQKSWRKLDTDHQRGQYYEHCSRSIVPQILKKRRRCLPLLSFSQRDEEIYSSRGEKKDQQ